MKPRNKDKKMNRNLLQYKLDELISEWVLAKIGADGLSEDDIAAFLDANNEHRDLLTLHLWNLEDEGQIIKSYILSDDWERIQLFIRDVLRHNTDNTVLLNLTNEQTTVIRDRLENGLPCKDEHYDDDDWTVQGVLDMMG
jgi:hypothetical protein